MNGKFYWLKLKKDFFKRHDIKILESMPDGKISVLFYLKLMLESIDHEGELRFSDEVPYSVEMLATITDTDIEIAKESISRLQKLGMIEVNQEGTFVLSQVKSMIGCAADSDNANRQRRYRERKKAEKQTNVTACNVTNVTGVTDSNVTCVTKNNESKSIDIEIDIEKRNSKEKRVTPVTHFIPPTVDEVRAYCLERRNNVDPEKFIDFYESKGWYVGKNKMKDWRAAVRNWERGRDNRPQTNINTNGNPFLNLLEGG